MNAHTMRWYNSKIDWWLALILCVPPLASIGACVAVALSGKTSDLPWAIGSVLLVVAVYFGLVFPLRYGLDGKNLLVRFGMCRQRIPLEEILDVSPTRSILSAPALSLDRLRVRFGQGFSKAVVISPAERSRFLEDLGQTAGLKREGDRLKRR